MENPCLTLVLMAGLPGAGKTTLAARLGKSLGWPVIDKDKIKDEFTKDGYDNVEAGNQAYEESFALARDTLLNDQKSVILDSTAIHQFILDDARKIVSDIVNVHLKVILCVIEKYLRDYRLLHRPYQAPTVKVDPQTITDYLTLFEHLPPDNTLTIYTDGLLDEYLQTAISYLSNTQQSTERLYEPGYKVPGG